MTKVRPASGIGNASVVPGGGASRIGGATVAQRRPMTAAEENARRAAPIPSAPGVGTGLPWDSIARSQAETAGSKRYNTDLQVGANRAQGLQEFGLEHELGANGVYYDDIKNNPYSQAALLQHGHESNERGINTTAGQALYSGQTGNAQTIESGRTSLRHQELANAQAQAKAQWTAEEKAAQAAEEEAVNSAKEGAVERASNQPGPEVPLGNGGGGGNTKPAKPGSAPKGKAWAWNGSNWHLVKA